MTHEAAARIRAFLLDSDFTTDGVLARVGSEAFAALGRGLTVPVRRALAEPAGRPSDPSRPGIADPPAPDAPDAPDRSAPGVLDLLIEAFLLADTIPTGALPPDVVADLDDLGMVRHEGERLVPLVEVRPYGEPDTDWYVVSDIGAPTTPDHVLGLGGASLTLARITPRRDVGRAMDLGCGAGSQVLHAARHASRVVATDTNPRALGLTALTVALSGIAGEQVDLREGSLFGPVSDERFDLVMSNPPFVISPSHRFTYRDAGLPGDELSRLVVRGAAAHLAPGGMAAVLGNWLHVEGGDWRERVTEWVAGTGASAWIVERDTQSAADYAATWLREAQVPEGPEFDAAMHEWLDAFADEGCVDVGFGWFILVAPSTREMAGEGAPGAQPGGGDVPGGAPGPRTTESWVVVEDLAHTERLPRGDEVLAFVEGCAAVERLNVPSLLAAHAHLAEGASVTTTTHHLGASQIVAPPRLGLAGVVGPGGWRPAVTVSAALLSALLADPDTPIGERLDAAAQAEGLDPVDVLGPALMGLRELVRVGIVRTE
ncbi:MAG: class I SAM-dependent methyltransferase [Candidatus Nanopelagicales bacterium]|jgi:methylase of polypeptide subunit release factors|nr:class I SAM-dependent methyltransferase [Candidatus Nanopelagicales bacterium]